MSHTHQIAVVLVDSKPAPSQQVVDFAVLVLTLLRDQGFSDDEILRGFCPGHAEADTRFNRNQQITHGYVFAPASEVKAVIREMLLHP